MGQHGTAASGASDASGHDPTRVTRRTLLSGAAVAGAASLLAPGSGLAKAARPAPQISTRWVGGLSGTSPALPALERFSLVGVEWAAPATARIELRAQATDGRWSPWVNASITGHDGDGQTGGANFGEPLWTGPARAVQLRSQVAADGVRLHFVNVPVPGPASLAAAPAQALPNLAAGPGQPPVIARRAWAGGQAVPRHAPGYGTVKLAFVHHTVNPNGYSAAAVPAMLLGIFTYHVYVRGWWDIGYNFVIDAYGRIWEARAGGIDMAVVGAQAGAYNTESTGVAMLGDFMNVTPSPPALAALQRLLAWKLSLHGIPTSGRVTVVVDPADAYYTPFRPGAHVSLPRVAGHRDGDSTDCPGNALYDDLPNIRRRTTALAGTPAHLSLSHPATPITAGSSATVSGQLGLLSGAPLAGAPIEIQQLLPRLATARTLLSTTTASDGTWSATVAVQGYNTLVRALHRPYPATVSDWVKLAVAPVLTLQAPSSSPLVLTGTISAAKPRVTIAVYDSSGRLVARKRVKVTRDSFTAQLALPGPGTYTAVARSAPDAVNAGGSSAPVTVTVS